MTQSQPGEMIEVSRVNGLGMGRSNEWYTPPEIFDALGCAFDLDVAHPQVRTHVPARNWFTEMDDGLRCNWRGFVWMNPPFGGRNGLAPWLDKFFAHGNGIALTPDRTSAPWFHDAWKRADAVMFCRKTPFLLPSGQKAGSPAFGTALWASGEQGVAALERACGLGFGLLAFTALGDPKKHASKVAKMIGERE